jgi:hypothetical protein
MPTARVFFSASGHHLALERPARGPRIRYGLRLTSPEQVISLTHLASEPQKWIRKWRCSEPHMSLAFPRCRFLHIYPCASAQKVFDHKIGRLAGSTSCMTDTLVLCFWLTPPFFAPADACLRVTAVNTRSARGLAQRIDHHHVGRVGPELGRSLSTGYPLALTLDAVPTSG